MRPIPFLCVALAGLVLNACSEPATDGGAISVYSTRHYDSDRILFKAFEEETGIRVRFREGQSAGLLEAMKAEGDASPADIIIAADAGTLWRFQDAGLLQPVESGTLNAAIPANYREPGGHWFGLSKRARVIAYDADRLAPDQTLDYGTFSDDALDNEVCMRPSSNIYNLSLMGELIERWGADDAEDWAEAVVDNFARQPTGGDTTQIRSIAAGECSIALVNHYYWVRLATSNSADDRAEAEAVTLAFPNSGAGTHVNVTGAGVAAHAPNREGAIAFLEYLTSIEGQSLLITETKEFPMVEGTPLPAGLEQLPDFVASNIPLSKFGENQASAQAIYDRAGWK